MFRSHKGVITRPISGQIQLVNPQTKKASDWLGFPALDAQVDEFDFTRKLFTASGEEIDLFKDLVSDDGRIEVHVKCMEQGQYYGFAQADCYIRRPDGSPIVNFAKVYSSIWVQAVIVIAIGVTVSTIVSGPVAMMFVAAFIILGLYRDKFVEIAEGRAYGGGPAESIVRIANQSNVMTQLDESVLATLVQSFDKYFSRPVMRGVGYCLPDFSALSTVDYAADGYNVPWDRVGQDVTAALGFVAALVVVGFFLLRTREVAK